MSNFNELLIKKTAFANITIPNAATTVSTGVYIPSGAIITGIRWNSDSAVTITGASATVTLDAGTVALHTAVAVSAMGAQTTPTSTALSIASGICLTTNSELKLVAQASSNSAATASYDFYVDYLYVAGH